MIGFGNYVVEMATPFQMQSNLPLSSGSQDTNDHDQSYSPSQSLDSIQRLASGVDQPIDHVGGGVDQPFDQPIDIGGQPIDQLEGDQPPSPNWADQLEGDQLEGDQLEGDQLGGFDLDFLNHAPEIYIPPLPTQSNDNDGSDSSLHHYNHKKRPYDDLMTSFYNLGNDATSCPPVSKNNATHVKAMNKACKLFSDVYNLDENELVRMVNFVRPDMCLHINDDGCRCTKPAIIYFCGYHKGDEKMFM